MALCVYLRDRQCQACENTQELEAHHINSAKFHPEQAYDAENGIILCDFCHRYLHSEICGGSAKFCSHEHLAILMQMTYHQRIQRKKKEFLLSTTILPTGAAGL